MLRITLVRECLQDVNLKVEGQIVAHWACEVSRECERWVQGHKHVGLDLSAVTYVDRQGLEMLKDLSAAGVRLILCPPLIQDLLDLSP